MPVLGRIIMKIVTSALPSPVFLCSICLKWNKKQMDETEIIHAHSFSHSHAHTHTYIFYVTLEISVIMSPDALEQQGKKQGYRYRLLKTWKASDGNLDPNLASSAKKAMLDGGLWDEIFTKYFFSLGKIRL